MIDELLDIVDKQDNVIGQKLRSEIYDEGLTNFRVVNVFLRNDEGKLWIPRRSQFKRIFPLCLDASMGGHVSAGETYQEALKRELMEELRIDLDLISYQELGSLTPWQHGMSAYMKVYLIKSNLVPNYNTDDFIEFYWLSPDEVLLALEEGDKAKGDLSKLIRYLFNNIVKLN